MITTSSLAVASQPFQMTQSTLSTCSSFERLLRTPAHELELDLSTYSMVRIMETFASYKRKSSPKFTNSPTIYNLRKIEQLYGLTIMPDQITDQFYIEFKQFLLNEGKKPSTILNYFDNIRSALNWASKHRAPVSETYNVYKVENYEKTKIALTPSQIALIYYYEIDKHHKDIHRALKDYPIRGFSFANMKKVQTQFVLDCNIGQRYSDAHRLDESCFDETKTVYKTIQQKTGSKARVDLMKNAIDTHIAMEILKNNNFAAPSARIRTSNFDKYLHLLCLVIGRDFLKTIKTENKINGELVTEYHQMWQLVTSHTARRTFITHHLNANTMSLPALQKCTGHRDLRQLNTYYVANEE